MKATLPRILDFVQAKYPELLIKEKEGFIGWDLSYPHGDKYATAYVERVDHDKNSTIESQAEPYIALVESLKNFQL